MFYLKIDGVYLTRDEVYLMLPSLYLKSGGVYLTFCMLHCQSCEVYSSSCMLHCRSGGVYLMLPPFYLINSMHKVDSLCFKRATGLCGSSSLFLKLRSCWS